MPLANITWNELDQLLRKGDFQTLFVGKLGWDYPESTQAFNITITNPARNAEASTLQMNLSPVVEKKSVSFLTADVGDCMITKEQRRRAERELTKHAHEHIVIYHTSDFAHQVWQVPRREPGKPIRLREYEYRKGLAANDLYEFVRKLHFSLRDEANLTLVDVIDRIDTGVQAEKVTEKFYDDFSDQRKDFVKAITGIADDNDRAWYAAIMLNRLMFSWFLQSKGLLDNDPNYLPTKLDAARIGKLPVPNFQSFYESFLKALFHGALNQPADQRDPALKKMLGNIPYINGGIFDRHRLETENTSIHIPDSAFEGIFALFGQYDWHLDDRPIAKPNEINPDVLGHIFEKFVNQKEKGAYYTKEDVTGYMSRNTIIPWLLDHAKKKVSIAFDHTQPGSVWRLLQNTPEKYIYGSMKHGVIDTTGDVLPLPDALRAGENDYSQRGTWNQRAEAPYALPTETWREYYHRRMRTLELIEKLRAGEVHEIDDLITLNLDIRQFMQDIVATEADVSLVKALWHGVRTITILDPTVGSGAFLFAAVRVLEPIADELLNRMDALVEADPSTHPNSSISEFKRILEERNAHPNQRYFIMRQIILHNLYGVDIEEEAVEICKLRLFLLLVAHLDDAKNIEPLPDLDFNIRAGNTLVGYASSEEVSIATTGQFRADSNSASQKAGNMALDLDGHFARIKQDAKIADLALRYFKQVQFDDTAGRQELGEAKHQYQVKLNELRNTLDQALHTQQGAKDLLNHWRIRTQPFHWFAEFHEIVVDRGGFDIIIGNPPYLEFSEVAYTPPMMKTSESRSIHGLCVERGLALGNLASCFSMILPMSIVSTQRMKVVQETIEDHRITWYSNYAWRPGKLFDDVNRALTIVVNRARHNGAIFSTGYQKWSQLDRAGLMEKLQYTDVSQFRNFYWVPKFQNPIENHLLRRLLSQQHRVGDIVSRSGTAVYYRTTGGLYWKVFTDFPPAFTSDGKSGKSSRQTTLTIADSSRVPALVAVLSSSFFWWWYTISSNLRDLNPSDIKMFPIENSLLDSEELGELGKRYLQDLQSNSTMQQRIQKAKGTTTTTQSFKVSKSKHIVDEIDRAIGTSLGLSAAELDFIQNYDIKFRLGDEEED